jgi:hypothetical protein
MADIARAMRGMSPQQAQGATNMMLQHLMNERKMEHQMALQEHQHSHEWAMEQEKQLMQQLSDAAKADLEERKFQLDVMKAEAEINLKSAQTDASRQEAMLDLESSETTKRIYQMLDEQGDITSTLGHKMPTSSLVHLADQHGVNLIPDDVGIDMGIHSTPDGKLIWLHRRPGETEPSVYNLAEGTSPEIANDIRKYALDYLGADSFSGLDRASQFQYLNIVSAGATIAARDNLSAVDAFQRATVATERAQRVFREVQNQIEAAKTGIRGKIPKPPEAAEIIARPPYAGEQSLLDFYVEYDLEPTVLEDAIVKMGYSRQEASDIIALAVRQYQRRR